MAAAALLIYERTFDDFDAVLAEVPDSCLDWTPVAGTNSLAVLARHGMSATAYLTAAAAGLRPDREAYVKGDRPEAFRARGTNVEALRREVAEAKGRLPAVFAGITAETLAAKAGWSFPGGTEPTGAELLVHAAAHLREHVGQAQLMRDLWLANSREGR